MKKLFQIIPFIFLFISCKSENVPVEPERKEIKREFTKSIERVATLNLERDLIFRAESIYPNRDSVLAYMSIYIPQSSIPDSNLWFFEVFDGVLIPFAVTSEAISYYDNLIDSLSANNGYNFFIKANFEYRAEIEYKESYSFEGEDQFTGEPLPSVSFENVYVVSMALRWENYCGIMCGLWISHKRIVVFDESGNLKNVFYDGPIPIAVS